uniref:non-specific serine/threonine protein kinase n=1 Tax=Phlebotomus papatasi TaxID=29031 RepID=A0A1B0GMT1_PHLPP
KRVAVKVVNLRHEHCRVSLDNEGHILGWKHPNIIRIFKIVSDTNHGLVIMERIPGDNLQSILNTLNLGIRHALEILSQVASGLNYCHFRGVIHGDIKPQNILITLSHEKEGYLAKLCDFGSSSIENENPSDCRGTIRYMAPEALRKAPLTPKADIFSFGVTMWQIENHKVPYEEIFGNDIIVYRVVREGLRPDTCQEIDSPKIPKILLDGDSLEKRSFRSQRSISPREIKSETTVNINAGNSAERESGKPSRSLNALLKEARIENHEEISEMRKKIHWKNIFKPSKWPKNENYCNLFQSCWHEDPNLRPGASQLLNQLHKIIKNIQN